MHNELCMNYAGFFEKYLTNLNLWSGMIFTKFEGFTKTNRKCSKFSKHAQFKSAIAKEKLGKKWFSLSFHFYILPLKTYCIEGKNV